MGRYNNPKKTFKWLNNDMTARNITTMYIMFSAIWISSSDLLLKLLNLDTTSVMYFSVLKGYFFIFITGTMLFFLIQKGIEDIRTSEENLRKNDEMYKLLISGTTDGLWEFDIKTKAFTTSYLVDGKKKDDIDVPFHTYSEWRKFVHPDDIEMVEAKFRSYVGRKISKFGCELRFKEDNDEYVWYHSKGQAIYDERGNVIKVIGTYTDISERKDMEQKLKEVNEANVKLLNELREYDKIKTEFFTNMSHEFRTPLNVILSSLQLVDSYQQKVENDLSLKSKLEKHMKVTRQNCYRLLKLINNLMDISKIDSGFTEDHFEFCNIVNIVEQITLSVVELIESKSISLTFDTDVEEKIILCDINKVERIILNLLSNATKYNNVGGRISVEVNDLKDYILITVKDTGIGIPEDKLDVIFERFRQVNSSLTRENEGSGIGLSIVKSLVEIHGGEIQVESEYGKGSKFSVKLPVKQENHQPFEENIDRNLNKYLYMASVEFSDV